MMRATQRGEEQLKRAQPRLVRPFGRLSLDNPRYRISSFTRQQTRQTLRCVFKALLKSYAMRSGRGRDLERLWLCSSNKIIMGHTGVGMYVCMYACRYIRRLRNAILCLCMYIRNACAIQSYARVCMSVTLAQLLRNSVA